MEKKYICIILKSNLNSINYVNGKVFIDNFENIKYWLRSYTSGTKYNGVFSKENTHVNISWKEKNNEYDICIVDDWNNSDQVSKFHNVLKKWREYADKACNAEIWYNTDGVFFCVFNKEEDPIYNISDEIYNISDEKYDLFNNSINDSEKYLFNVVNNLVKKELGEKIIEEKIMGKCVSVFRDYDETCWNEYFTLEIGIGSFESLKDVTASGEDKTLTLGEDFEWKDDIRDDEKYKKFIVKDDFSNGENTDAYKKVRNAIYEWAEKAVNNWMEFDGYSNDPDECIPHSEFFSFAIYADKETKYDIYNNESVADAINIFGESCNKIADYFMDKLISILKEE